MKKDVCKDLSVSQSKLLDNNWRDSKMDARRIWHGHQSFITPYWMYMYNHMTLFAVDADLFLDQVEHNMTISLLHSLVLE